MPAYSFKERFVPLIVDRSKTQTVRSRRRYPGKVGDKVYLYFGMRTKWVRKLGEGQCVKTYSIHISKEWGIIIYDRLLSEVELNASINGQCIINGKTGNHLLPGHLLIPERREYFAWDDGFRPEGSTKESPKGSFDLMMRFWSQTHQLPFVGDVIHWEFEKY